MMSGNRHKAVLGDIVELQYKNDKIKRVTIGAGNDPCLEYACVGKNEKDEFEYFGKVLCVVRIFPKTNEEQDLCWVPKVTDLFVMPKDRNSMEAEQLKFGYVNDETETELENLKRKEQMENTTVVVGHLRTRNMTPDIFPERAIEDAKKYREFREKPYEYRIDYYNKKTGDKKRIYVGRHRIKDLRSGNYHVLKWNDNFLQLKKQDAKTDEIEIVPNNVNYDDSYQLGTVSSRLLKRVICNGKEYKLELKRTYEFGEQKNGVDFNTEYDSRENAEITDPILRKILKRALEDKRHQTKMTDIVFSIQEEQHKIMYEPIEKNMIIQGCAGSGKTMILTHRISVLLNRDHKLSPENILILAPSELLVDEMEGLSVDLEIEKVQKKTIDLLYKELVQKYIPDYTLIGNYEDETNYNEEVLRKAYEKATFDKIEQKEKQLLEDKRSKINKHFSEMADLIKRYRIKKPTGEQNFEQYFSDAKQTMENLINAIKQEEKIIKEIEKVIKTDKQRISDSKEEAKTAQNKIWKEVFETVENIEARKQECIQENKKITVKSENIRKQLSQNAIVRTGENYVDADGRVKVDELISSNNPSLQEFGRDYLKLTTEIEQLQQKISELDINNIDAQVENTIKMSQLQIKRKELYDSIPKQEDLITLSNEKELNKQLTEYRRKYIQNQSCIRVCDLCVQSLHDIHDGIWPNLEQIEGHEIIDDLINSYQKLEETIRIQSGRAENIEKELKKSEQQLLVLKERQPSKDETKLFEQVKKEMETSSMIKIVEVMMKKICEENKIDASTVCRIQLLFLLQLCYGYSQKPVMHNLKLICIDEAQEISALELGLLKKIMGESTRWNLYGDYMQVSTTYKGKISNDELWIPLKNQIDATQYMVNNNYRNSQEIVNYCNELFGIKIQAMGLHGEVINGDLTECVKCFAQCVKKREVGDGIAIIAKTNDMFFLDDVINKMRRYLGNQEIQVSYDKSQNNDIVFLDINRAKGIEFRHVLVNPKNMTESEKYIAYTRAMENLYVITK